jgi:hypothetical protein
LKKIFLIGLLIFFVFSQATAQTKVANDPSRISVGARLLGMGKSFIGEADDINSIFINPAGLASLKNWQITSMSGKFINEVNYINMAGASPVQLGTVGFGYITSDLSFSGPAATTEVVDGIRIIPSSTEGVSYSYKNSALLLSMGSDLKGLTPWQQLDAVSTGATIKMFFQSLSGPGISGGTASGYELDLGVKYSPWPALQLGFMAQNVLPFSMGGKIHWASGSDESLPSVFKLGTSTRIIGPNGFRTVGDQALTFNWDFEFTPLRPLPSLSHMGLEWSPIEILDLRLGYDQDYVGKGGGLLEAANNLTAGVGITYQGFRFDYAYHQYYSVPENDTSYFSLSYGIFKKPPPPKEKLLVISPADKSIIYTDKILVTGEVLDRSIKRITINNQETALNDQYQFSLETPLQLKKNSLVVIGLDSLGSVQVTRKVRVIRLTSFTDVAPNYWAKDPVLQLATLKILTGYPDNTFRPNKGVNRAEFATLLTRVVDLPLLQVRTNPYKDVKKTHWAAKYILTASRAKIVKGYPDKTFKPQRGISRAEGVSAIVRLEGLDLRQPVYEVPFADIPGRHWAIKEINAAKNAGFLKFLEGGAFLPKQNLTRGELAEIISHAKPVSDKVSDLLDFEKGY